jgi:hypothetical protein
MNADENPMQDKEEKQSRTMRLIHVVGIALWPIVFEFIGVYRR